MLWSMPTPSPIINISNINAKVEIASVTFSKKCVLVFKPINIPVPKHINGNAVIPYHLLAIE